MPTVVGDTSPTPARQTRDQLVTQILRYVKAPNHAELTQVAIDEINNAIRRLNMRVWYWSLDSDDITLVAGTGSYTIAGAFKAARAGELLDGSGNFKTMLEYLDPVTFDEWHEDRTTGTPTCYTAFNVNDALTVTLSNAPTAAFVASYPTLRLRYFTRIAVFTSNSNFTGPSEVEDYVIWHARHAVALQTDPALAAPALSERERVWRLLVSDDCQHHFHGWSS